VGAGGIDDTRTSVAAAALAPRMRPSDSACASSEPNAAMPVACGRS